jgi:5-methylcytosine-specific restriction endonuclease McrA
MTLFFVGVDVAWFLFVNESPLGISIWVVFNCYVFFSLWKEGAPKRELRRQRKLVVAERQSRDDYFRGISGKNDPVSIIRCAIRYEKIFSHESKTPPMQLSENVINWTGEWLPARRSRRRRTAKTTKNYWSESEEWRLRKGIFRGLCVYCGVSKAIDREHATPKSRGGGDSPSNILPSCRDCNLAKHKKLLTEFVDYRQNAELHVTKWISDAYAKEGIPRPKFVLEKFKYI